MLRLILVSLFAIHCNCQLISIGGAGYGRSVLLSPNGVSSIGSYGGLGNLGSLGYTNYGGIGSYLGTQSLYGLRPLGGIGLNSYVSHPLPYHSAFINPSNYGFGFSSIGGMRPQALNLVSAAHPEIAVNAISAQKAVPVNAAVKQVGRTVEYKPVPFTDEPIVPQYVVVEPSDIPLHIHFKSRSSTIRLSQEHIPGLPGTVEVTRSRDEPSKVVHEVSKPVIQEVREFVQPYRKVIQELQPVIENVHTIIAKGEGERRRYFDEPIAKTVERSLHQVIQPYDTYQTIAQQFNPYQSLVHPIEGYRTYGSHLDGYQVLVQPNIYGYDVPAFGHSVYDQAINSFRQPFGTSYGSYGPSFGYAFGQRPVDEYRPNSGSGVTYDRSFTPGFASGYPSGQRPSVTVEIDRPNGGSSGYGGPVGGQAPKDEANEDKSVPNEDSDADSKNESTSDESSSSDSSKSESDGV
jgi:hypothetical protein